jgi:hypothetical protein
VSPNPPRRLKSRPAELARSHGVIISTLGAAGRPPAATRRTLRFRRSAVRDQAAAAMTQSWAGQAWARLAVRLQRANRRRVRTARGPRSLRRGIRREPLSRRQMRAPRRRVLPAPRRSRQDHPAVRRGRRVRARVGRAQSLTQRLGGVRRARRRLDLPRVRRPLRRAPPRYLQWAPVQAGVVQVP